jgi:cell division protein ZapA
MKPIKVTIMGRQFPLRVEESDEQMMYEIASFVDQRIRTYKNDLLNQAEPIVLILACLSIAEELFKAKQQGSGDIDLFSSAAGIERANQNQQADMSNINILLKEILSEFRQ